MYKRVLLKLSGEALAADRGFGVDVAKLHEISLEILAVRDLGVEVAIVVGGGNFFRGVADQARMMDRVSADHMGMLLFRMLWKSAESRPASCPQSR
jgi:uridylate kinase